MVTGDHEIDTGLWLEHTPGHTPVWFTYMLNTRRTRIFCGDLMHHPLQVPNRNGQHVLRRSGYVANDEDGIVDRHAETTTRSCRPISPTSAAGTSVAARSKPKFEFARYTAQIRNGRDTLTDIGFIGMEHG